MSSINFCFAIVLAFSDASSFLALIRITTLNYFANDLELADQIYLDLYQITQRYQ